MGWLDYMSDMAAIMQDCTPKPFNEKRKGWCKTNTADDRRHRKDRARELTRINMQKKEDSK